MNKLSPVIPTTDEGLTRRRRHASGRGVRPLNMTPMIDVVFLLLIYFLVATDFRGGEEIYRLDLPDRSGATAQSDPFDLEEEPLRILVSGLEPTDARIRVEGPYEQPRSFDALHEFLNRRQINDVNPGGLFPASHPILIQPTGGAAWSVAVEAFNAAARAGYTNVTLEPPAAGL